MHEILRGIVLGSERYVIVKISPLAFHRELSSTIWLQQGTRGHLEEDVEAYLNPRGKYERSL